jgi:hypothetical protein
MAMLATVNEALHYYSSLPATLRVPSLHPHYVLADAVRSAKSCPEFFIYQRRGHVYYHPFLVEDVPEYPGLIDLQSTYGYGGPVASTRDRDFLNGAWRAFDEWCRESGVLAEFVRFHPVVANERFFPGDVIGNRQTVWMDLLVPDLMASYTTRARTAIRKAEKGGLRVEWWCAVDFLNVFPELYVATMRELNVDAFYLFPIAYYESLLVGDYIWRAVCLDGNNNVLAGAVFLIGEMLMEYHLSASTHIGKTMGATNLILHEAARKARLCGKKFFHLGGGSDDCQDNSLLFFKSGFSSRRADFRIGRMVHQPVVYAQLKADWEAKHGQATQRVLFYR